MPRSRCSSLMLALLATLVAACTGPNPAFFIEKADAGDPPIIATGGRGGGAGGAGPRDVASDLTAPEAAADRPVDLGADLLADLAVDVPADAPPASPLPAAVGHWPLDAAVVNQRNGTAGGLSGTASWSTMVSPANRSSNAGSLQLDGRAGHAWLDVAGLPRYESAKTVSLWYWLGSALGPSSGRKYLLVTTSSSVGAALELLLIDGYPTAFIGGSEPTGTDIISSVAVHAGWNHLVYTFNPSDPAGANMNTVYVDTMLGRSRAMAPRPGPVAEAFLGTVEPGNADSTNFNGLIDDIRFYDRALGRAEIQALFSGAP